MPVYNELATLRTALDRLLAVDMPVATEVLVVDDGSTDGCLDTIDDLEASGRVRVVRQPTQRRQGLGPAAGHRGGRANCLTHPRRGPRVRPRRLRRPAAADPRAVRPTSSTAPAYFGGHAAYSFWYVVGNKALAMWASLLFDAWLSDIETCLKVAPTELWRKVDLSSNGFGIEAEVTGKFLGMGERIFEVADQLQGPGPRGGQEAALDRWGRGAVDPAQDPSPEALTRGRRGCRP